MLKRSAFAVAALVLAVLLLLQLAAAESGGPSLDIKYSEFHDANSVWSKSPSFELAVPLGELQEWNASWEQELDAVTGASRYLGSTTPSGLTYDGTTEASRYASPSQAADQASVLDGTTGATKNGGHAVEYRASETFSLAYSREGRGGSAFVSMSHEADYTSYAPGISLSWDFNGRNTTLSASYSHNFDDFRGRPPLWVGGKKDIDSWSTSLAQSWTALTLTSIGIQGIHSRGYLGHPYTPVTTTEGTLLDESVPDHRFALVWSASLRQGWTWNQQLKGAVHIDARRYDDSWGLGSWTVDNQYYHYLSEDTWIRLRWRWYRQSATSFAKDEYSGDEVYRTADIRFFAFTSHTIGGKIQAPFPYNWRDANRLVPDSWNLSFDWQTRDTHGNRELYQFYPQDSRYWQYNVVGGVRYEF